MATPKTWAKLQPLEAPANLSDIETEQLAESVQERKLNKYSDDDNRNVMWMEERKERTNEKCDTEDEILAHRLQNEFNQEYNTMLKNVEDKFNRDSKVRTSYTNYRMSSHDIKDEDNMDSDDSKRDFDRFVSIEKEYASIPRCGYKKVEGGSQIVTKHDISMTSRINACRVLEFPPGMSTGDIGSFDIKLNNKVFNDLRAHSHAQKKKGKPSVKPKV